MGADLEKTFTFLFGQLGVGGTSALIGKILSSPEVHLPLPAGGVAAGKAEDVSGLAD